MQQQEIGGIVFNAPNVQDFGDKYVTNSLDRTNPAIYVTLNGVSVEVTPDNQAEVYQAELQRKQSTLGRDLTRNEKLSLSNAIAYKARQPRTGNPVPVDNNGNIGTDAAQQLLADPVAHAAIALSETSVGGVLNSIGAGLSTAASSASKLVKETAASLNPLTSELLHTKDQFVTIVELIAVAAILYFVVKLK